MRNEYSPDDAVDATDLTVLASLAGVLDRIDPVPSGLVERTLFALTLEGLHTEVMELQRLEQPALAVRGQDRTVQARTITFTSDSITAMVTLSPAPSGVRIDGWAAPATRYDVELHRPDGVLHGVCDDDGSFVLADVPSGPASLVLRRVDGQGPAVSTPVVEL